MHARLKAAFPVLDSIDEGDLVAMSDAIAALAGGEEALRLTAVEAAEFTTAAPTYGHAVLAALLLEGVLDVLTTNWDNCVERGAVSERVPSVVTAHDLLHVVGRRVLKIHGCATQPGSLLLTTDHLQSPPQWVTDETRARLGNTVVVFVGIGDVAGYVEERLKEAIADVGNVDNIRVVGPGIDAGWASSEWSKLVPSLDDDHRIAATSDEFLEKLGAAYVHMTFADLAASLEGVEVAALAFDKGADGLRKHDALTILSWARRTGVVATPGASVLNSEPMAEAIAALGVIAADEFKITRDSTIETSGGYLEVLVSVGVNSAARLRREAQNRLEAHAARGAPEPTFLIAGGMGWAIPADVLPSDVLGDGDAADVVDGPMYAEPAIVLASEVLAA